MTLFPLPVFPLDFWLSVIWPCTHVFLYYFSYLWFIGLLGFVSWCFLLDFFWFNFLHSSTTFWSHFFSSFFWDSNCMYVRLRVIIPQSTNVLLIYFLVFFPPYLSFILDNLYWPGLKLTVLISHFLFFSSRLPDSTLEYLSSENLFTH